MDLRGVFFTDGEILDLDQVGSDVDLHFMMWPAGSGQVRCEIRFRDCGELRFASDALGSRVERALHGGSRGSKRDGNVRSTLTLVDDHEEELLFVEFAIVDVHSSDIEQPVVVNEYGSLEFHPSPGRVAYGRSSWVLGDPAVELFLADGSRLGPSFRRGVLGLERTGSKQDGAADLRTLLLEYFARRGVRPLETYRRMPLAELVAEGVRGYFGG